MTLLTPQESKEVEQDFKEIKEGAKQKEKFRVWTAKDILSHDFGKEEWLVEPLIPLQTMTALSGDPGNFKTWLVLELAKVISLGNPFLGNFSVEQGAVLIVDEENHLRHIQKRFQQLQIPDTAPIYFLSQNEIKIDKENDLKEILKFIKQKKVLLIVFDSLIRIHSGNENEARDMANILSKLKKITTTGTNVLFTHHHRKESSFGPKNPSASLRGSSDILATVDCHLTVQKEQKGKQLLVRQTKLRQAEQVSPFLIDIKSTGKSITFQFQGYTDTTVSKLETAKEEILQILESKDRMSRKELNKHLENKFGGNTIGKACKQLLGSEEIEEVPRTELSSKERKQNFYRLPK